LNSTRHVPVEPERLAWDSPGRSHTKNRMALQGRNTTAIHAAWRILRSFRANGLYRQLTQGFALGCRIAALQAWSRGVLVFVALGMAITSARTCRAQQFTFDDIEFWVGSGVHRAALVIDWVENATQPPALVWGYRWEGAATGANMLAAILADDDRLFAKLGGSAVSPVAVYGLGYDANGDGQFAVDDGTLFDDSGIAITGPADSGIAVDGNDYYAEGWYTGFWHYGVSSNNPFDGGSWSDTAVPMAGRTLSDGCWDSWAFTPTYNFAAFAQNPVAAASPFLPGDYDRNDTIDVADYQLWKSNFDTPNMPAIDGNGNGVVDAADYTVWRDHLGASSNLSASGSFTVPEPPACWLALCALCVFCLVCFSSERKRI